MYSDAEIAMRAEITRLRSVIRELESTPIIVEVKGGVAYCTSCPDGLDVKIIDHDNE